MLVLRILPSTIFPSRLLLQCIPKPWQRRMTLSLSTIYAKAAHVSVCPSVRLSDNFLSVCSSVQTAVCVHFFRDVFEKSGLEQCFCLSLSFTHTHTRTHADTQFHFFFHYRFTSKKSLFFHCISSYFQQTKLLFPTSPFKSDEISFLVVNLFCHTLQLYAYI